MRVVAAGLLAAFVGFASSFAVVLQGLMAVGASRTEAASGLMALAKALVTLGTLRAAPAKVPVVVPVR